MIQKKSNNNSSNSNNNSIRVYNSILLYIICIISVLTINLVNMGRGFGMVKQTEEEFEQQFKKEYPTIQAIAEHYENSLGAMAIKGIAEFTTDETLKQKLYDVDVNIRMAVGKSKKSSADSHKSAKLLSLFIEDIIHELPECIITKMSGEQLFTTKSNGIQNSDIFYRNIGFIRNWFDHAYDTAILSASESVQQLYQKLDQIFYHSKTLLVLSTYKQIASSYQELLLQENKVRNMQGNGTKAVRLEKYNISTSLHKHDDDQYMIYKTHNINFKYGPDDCAMFFEPKSSGFAFGNSVIVGKKTSENVVILDKAKIFFLKAHYHYSAKNNQGSDSAVNDTITTLSSGAYISRATKQMLPKLLDLKEPYVYKALEELSFGPKTYFMINPYIKNGFYILTANLSDKRYNFVLAKDWKFNRKNIMPTAKVQIGSEKKDNLFLINLREMYITSSIFSLSDIKEDNVGFVIKKNIEIETMEEQLTQNVSEWKFVDFIAHNTFEDKIGNNFTTVSLFFLSDKDTAIRKLGNPSLIKEPKDRAYCDKLALKQFENRLQQYRLNHKELFNNEEQINDEQILKTLLQQQAQYIKDLMNTERGESEDEAILRHPTEKIEGEERFRNRTNAELIGFKIGYAPDDVTDPEELLQYITCAFKDLDAYTNNTVENYKTLEAYINKEYNIYFDENGDLRPETQQQAQQN